MKAVVNEEDAHHGIGYDEAEDREPQQSAFAPAHAGTPAGLTGLGCTIKLGAPLIGGA